MESATEYLKRIGRKGGQAKSPKKAAASRKNIALARAVRKRTSNPSPKQKES